MATEEQNVYITGSSLADWSTEATQKQIQSSLTQIQADGNAMIRFLHHIANGTKVSAKELAKATTEIQKNTNTEAKGNQREKITDNKIVNSQQKISSGILSTISAITGLGDSVMDAERKRKKQTDITNALLEADYSQEDAERGAARKMRTDHWMDLKTKMVAFGVATMSLVDMFKGAAEQGFAERYAMVAEMRQAGLLARMTDTEAGFISLSHTISAANFTFGEATQFTKQFAKTVGVLGVKSALSFANTVADSRIENGMGYMEKYALEFGQVSNIAGEYLDTLRIGGQLRGIDDRSMRTGMDDFMSNVEMTSNVLKISMEDAADLMKKAFGSEDVALLATLPAEQRDAIEEGFLAMGAQGNPMAETLAKRLAAGSKGAFQHTAEWQEMVGTAPGREVLDFVEQMAQQLENGDTGSFQSALAEGFPKLADSLIELSSRGGVRIQLLNEPQLASMVGQIIEAAQTYGDADKGTKMGTQNAAEQAQVAEFIQIREALIASEGAINVHMADFVQNVKDLTAENRELAITTGRVLAAYKGVVGMATDTSTWIETFKKATWSNILGLLPLGDGGDAYIEGLFSGQGDYGYGKKNPSKITKDQNVKQDDQLADMRKRYADMLELSGDEKKKAEVRLSNDTSGLMTTIAALIKYMENQGGFSEEDKDLILTNAINTGKFAAEMKAYTIEQRQQNN